MKKEQFSLRNEAKRIWDKAKKGGSPTKDERNTMINAYWDCVLPSDPDYSAAQWVEDKFPTL
jgi:hypothetical protein